MKKGVSLISLIITIIVILILASIAVFSSLDTANQSELVKNRTELENVATFVRAISSRAEADWVDLGGLNSITLASEEEIKLFVTNGTNSELTNAEVIHNYNKNLSDSQRKYGFFYVTGEQIENDQIPGLEGVGADENFTVPTKVLNDYLINFSTGTVIAKVYLDTTLVRGILPE